MKRTDYLFYQNFTLLLFLFLFFCFVAYGPSYLVKKQFYHLWAEISTVSKFYDLIQLKTTYGAFCLLCFSFLSFGWVTHLSFSFDSLSWSLIKCCFIWTAQKNKNRNIGYACICNFFHIRTSSLCTYMPWYDDLI